MFGVGIKLREKNGETIVMPVQHKLEEFLDVYIEVAGGAKQFPFELGKSGRPTKRQPLFRSTRGRSGILNENRMSQKRLIQLYSLRAHIHFNYALSRFLALNEITIAILDEIFVNIRHVHCFVFGA